MSGLTGEERDALGDWIVKWIYNGIDGHMGPPPPREIRADLDLEAENVIDAILASDWLAAREATARAEGAEAALRDAAHEIATSMPYNHNLRPDGSEDPIATAYDEGQRDACAILDERAAIAAGRAAGRGQS